MPEPVLAFGQAKAGVVRVGKWLTVTFPSAALGKTMVQTQEGDWKVGGHCKKKKVLGCSGTAAPGLEGKKKD